jgi:asparagine synthase (glutamine-hydrolysing)
MTWDLRRRGPDSAGFFEDDHASLGHRRLAIIDLVTGDQPIAGDGPDAPWIVSNGELYNYRALADELRSLGVRFRTTSDTEVLLKAFQRWGTKALTRFEGIFAFAVWEPRARRLTLARDHLGVKPLRYRVVGERIYFASETRALFRTPGFRRQPRAHALDALLALRYEPDGDVFEDARQLSPGHVLVFEEGRARIEEFWRPRFARRAASLDEDAREWGRLFDESVKSQLVADVPVGIFLSGGLDSSAVLDAATRAGARGTCAFSIGFGTARDELDKAALVARHYGARHERIVVTPASFRERLADVFASLDEPVLDAIQVATYLLAEAASREVKVVLSGDGSDETLAGYVHHQILTWIALARRVLPGGGLSSLASIVRRLPVALLDRFFPYPAYLGTSGRDRVARLVEALGSPAASFLEIGSLMTGDERANLYTAAFRERLACGPSLAVRTEARLERILAGTAAGTARRPVDRILANDLETWLPNNVCMKLDRLTMAHGLEGRVPFLDRALVEHALGSSWKGPPHRTKLLLRRALAGRLPGASGRQKKQSFYFPIEESLGESWERLARELLAPDRVRRRGIVQPAWVERLLARGSARELLESKRLFALVALELWMSQVLDAPLAPLPADELAAGRRPAGW